MCWITIGTMSAAAILAELKSLGSDSIKNVLMKHGARVPFFGVKVADLKRIQKRIKKDYQLALDLYATGNSDAMYLAGLIADDEKMTKKDLQRWADGAYWSMLTGYTVPWVAAGSLHGWELALKWIDSTKENVASVGWCTLGCIVSMEDDADLDVAALKKLLDRVEKEIHRHSTRLAYAMNTFLISVGAYVNPLSAEAVAAAKRIGKVECDMGDTSCRVPYAPDYIKKCIARGSLKKKKKTCKC